MAQEEIEYGLDKIRRQGFMRLTAQHLTASMGCREVSWS